MPWDSNWLIEQFISNYKSDIIKPWLTDAIRSAVDSIMKDSFTGVVGTTFMFGIIEHYAKHKLGFNPMNFHLDDVNQKKLRDISIGAAIIKLKRTNTDLGRSLSEIDKHHMKRHKEVGIKDDHWIKTKIEDRLSLARNMMTHGESHSFYSVGGYLIMLYVLFYYHDLKEKNSANLSSWPTP